MSPTLTRRGQAVLGIAVLGLVLGWGFGGRSLNAVVMPSIALLAGTGVYAIRFEAPTVTREAPEYGHQGMTQRIGLRVDAPQKYTAVVYDRLQGGLRGDPRHDTVADGRRLAYDLDLARRGVHTIGPCVVTARDPLGIWERRFRVSDTHRITVYPRIHELTETADLLSGYVGITDDREQFDGVREYVRGDPLRDVNWKASAKHPRELVVTEFAGEGASDEVTIAAESLSGRTDSVAEAAASIAVHLLDAGIAVGLATPDGLIDPAHGDPHRRRILSTLAGLDRGRVRRGHRDEADIFVRAPENGSHVEVVADGRSRRYAEVLGRAGTTQGVA